MARSDDIVGYSFRAALFCPRCISVTLARRGWPIAPGELRYAPAAEPMLDELAMLKLIDREREVSFDSDNFPKVMFRDQANEHSCCENCGTDLREYELS